MKFRGIANAVKIGRLKPFFTDNFTKGAFECLDRSYEKYVYGTEHGYKYFSDMHNENLKPEFEYLKTKPIEEIYRDYCFKIWTMLENIDREFPESFKCDPRYEWVIQKFKAFVEKY